MITRFYTFGWGHFHSVDGFTYDKDIVVKITAEDPRAVMVQWFGRKWGGEYETLEDVGMEWYPRGVREIGLSRL